MNRINLVRHGASDETQFRPSLSKTSNRKEFVMYYYSSSFEFLGVVILVVAIAALVAWILAISKLVSFANAKGHSDAGTLWFIGLFASPIVLGLIVCAMPDKQPGLSEPNDLPTV